VSYASLMTLPGAGEPVCDPVVAEQVEIQVKYDGYITRQRDEVLRREQYEATLLPRDLDYLAVRGLSKEVQQKLNQHKPETLGQASRISGLTPAAISLLLVHLKRGFRDTGRKAQARLDAPSSAHERSDPDGDLPNATSAQRSAA